MTDYTALNTLAQRWDKSLMAEARSAVQRLLDDEPDIDADTAILNAAQDVEQPMFDSEAWGDIEAVDISDVAWEAARRAWDERNTWL